MIQPPHRKTLHTDHPRRSHICYLYSSDQAYLNVVMEFIVQGLQQGERIGCYSDRMTETQLREMLAKQSLDQDKFLASDTLQYANPHEVYFTGGVFRPDSLLEQLRDFHLKSKALGYTASRIIGEMPSLAKTIPGHERIPEYESKVTLALLELNMSAVCLYDASTFDHGILKEVLKTHPHIHLNGMISQNPYYIPPVKYLGGV